MAYLVILFIVIGVILVKFYFISMIQVRFGFENNGSSRYAKILAYHKRIDSNIPDDAVIFIGDSITEGLAVSSISPVSVNYGIGSDTTLGVLQRLSN